ncbi:hypothetical protein [Streptomyces subrutilus]|uniref:hypothetical protein n=1 Tax=Streptomyces subrutilus TaxID=36818 RepID=UPI001FCB0EC1|nr:hypothetical protein [Streptomyces subrutilus]
MEDRTIPLPEVVTDLLARLEKEVARLAKSPPLAVVRTPRHLEMTAEEVGFWEARGTGQDTTDAQAVPPGLGLSPKAARALLACFSQLIFYS